jgi:hypothetical protein
MKPINIGLLCLVFTVTGCQQINKKDDYNYSKIAGIWKAKNSGWQIEISENGDVLSAVFPMGEAIVKPGKTTSITMLDNQKSTFQSGKFPLYFDDETGQLDVTIEIEKIHIKYLDDELIGSNNTIFTGFIDNKGEVWSAVYFEIFDYGMRFPQNEEDIEGTEITFTREVNQ